MHAETDVSAHTTSSISPAATFTALEEPDDEHGEGSPALVSITFLLRNFSEMNKLWTRMQRNLPQSDARDVVRKVFPASLSLFSALKCLFCCGGENDAMLRCKWWVKKRACMLAARENLCFWCSN
jgi:hypothetical protein